MTIECRSKFGQYGNWFSLILYLAPVWPFYKIWRRENTDKLSITPYVLTLLNCMFWVVYGLPIVHPDNIIVTKINGAGFVLQAIYVAIFIIYSNRDCRVSVLKWLAGMAVIFVAAVVLTFMLDHSHERRSSIVRILCCISGIFMYGSSLLDIRDIITGIKEAGDVPFCVSVATFLNTAIWTAYSSIYFDETVRIPNAIGVLLSTVKIVLYLIWCSKTRVEDDLPQQLDERRQPLLQSTVSASMQLNDNEDEGAEVDVYDNEDEGNEEVDEDEGVEVDDRSVI